jgi:hypothetical protein
MPLDTTRAKAGTKAQKPPQAPKGTLAPSSTVQTITQAAQAKADQLVIESREAVRAVMQETKGRIETAITEELEDFEGYLGESIGALLGFTGPQAPLGPATTIETTATEVPV